MANSDTSTDAPTPAVPPAWEPCPSLPPIKIRDVRAICTAPGDARLVIVKIETTEPEIYGLGCASYRTRPLAVVTAIEEYLKPLLVGRDPDNIEDIYQAAFVSSYWRSGPILNNALCGVDTALWDIKGKRAGMPVYQLLGGKVRKAAWLYAHATGQDVKDLEENVRYYMEKGYRYVRAQMKVPGYSTYGVQTATGGGPLDVDQEPWEPGAYIATVPKMFDHLRNTVGWEVELLHDVHERVPPIQAIGLAKEMEQYKLFFLEDPFSPEDIGYFPLLKQHTTTPIAMGELFVNQAEYVPLIKDRLVDFIRVRLNYVGGLSVARKIAAFSEFFGVRTAWQAPNNLSPVGHTANLHLDLNCYNFGVQEGHEFSDLLREVFPGTPEIKDGMLWCNEKPGLGIDIDEELAAKYPYPSHPLQGGQPEVRRLDGTVIRP
jgi:mannonate dehydratase